jgi:hypothetical protein
VSRLRADWGNPKTGWHRIVLKDLDESVRREVIAVAESYKLTPLPLSVTTATTSAVLTALLHGQFEREQVTATRSPKGTPLSVGSRGDGRITISESPPRGRSQAIEFIRL